MAGRLAFVQRLDDGRLNIKLKDGSRVVDRGDQLLGTTPRVVNDGEILAMVEIAKAKGWSSIAISGSIAFRARAAEIALANGLAVRDQPTASEAPPSKATTETRGEAEARKAEMLRAERERMQRALSKQIFTSAPKFRR